MNINEKGNVRSTQECGTSLSHFVVETHQRTLYYYYYYYYYYVTVDYVKIVNAEQQCFYVKFMSSATLQIIRTNYWKGIILQLIYILFTHCV
jgi:hypothetical protein